MSTCWRFHFCLNKGNNKNSDWPVCPWALDGPRMNITGCNESVNCKGQNINDTWFVWGRGSGETCRIFRPHCIGNKPRTSFVVQLSNSPDMRLLLQSKSVLERDVFINTDKGPCRGENDNTLPTYLLFANNSRFPTTVLKDWM